MRIKSPVGEYDFQVTDVRLGRSGVEVDGSLGMWQTTTVLSIADVARLIAPVAGVAALALYAGRRWAQLSG